MWKAVFVFIVSTACAQTSCVVNEIMYAPLGGEPEWVELYNPTAQPVNIKNWKIRDLTVTKKTITTKDVLIAPGGYAVLAHDSTVVNFHFTIPAQVITLVLPSLNNDSDAVIIYDAAGNAVDSLVYHAAWGGAGGASLERVRAALPSTSAANWRSSHDIERSTPGRRNDAAPKPIDVAVDSVTALAIGQNRFRVTAFLRNTGEFPIDTLSVMMATDHNRDSIIDAGELFYDAFPGAIAPDGALSVSAETPRLLAARRFLVWARAARDGDSTNDRGAIAVRVTHPRNSVVINEIMYAPQSPEPEWIELQCRGDDTVDCSLWGISTGSGAAPVSDAPLLVPGDYVVITRDTESMALLHPDIASHILYAPLPTLVNTGGKVILRDDAGETIDSVPYRSTWGGANGMSLERIDSAGLADDSTNWRSSADTGGTCGRRNSRARRDMDAGIAQATLSADSSDVEITVKNYGLHTAENIFVTAQIDSVAGDAGDLGAWVTTLIPGNTGTMHVPIHGLPAGDNIISIAARVDGDEQAENDRVSIHLRGSIPARSLIINELMFAPRTGGSEYVELVNAGPSPVNLLGCRLSGSVSPSTHKADTLVIATVPMVIASGEYALIAADTMIFAGFPLVSSAGHLLLQHKSSLGLGNDSDIVVIADARGSMVDSVRYTSAWHSPNVHSGTGIALEKINPRLTSTERLSWASSVAGAGGTPDATNSVFTLLNIFTGRPVEPSEASLEAAPNPFSPDGDGFEDFTMLHYTLPFEASTYALRMFSITGRMVRALVNTGRASHEGTIAWDGRDEEGVPLPLGAYIALLDAVDAVTGQVVRVKASVIVARRL